MSAKPGCSEQMSAGCVLSGLMLSVVTVSLLPLLVGTGTAFGLAWLADRFDREDAGPAVGKTGYRTTREFSPEAELLWKNTDGIWVKARDRVYHVPFAGYPSLDKAGVADLCDVELREGRNLYWPAPRQTVPLYAIQESGIPFPPDLPE